MLNKYITLENTVGEKITLQRIQQIKISTNNSKIDSINTSTPWIFESNKKEVPSNYWEQLNNAAIGDEISSFGRIFKIVECES